MTGRGRRGLDDFEDCSDTSFCGADTEEGPHGLGNPSFTTDYLALVIGGDLKADDYPVVLFFLRDYYVVWGVCDEPGKVLDELFHPSFTFCKVPDLFKSLATLSVG